MNCSNILMLLSRTTVTAALLGLIACSALDKQGQTEAEAIPDPAVQKQQQLANDYQAALAQHKEGEVEAARRAYEALLAQDPGLTSPRYNLAQLSLEAGDEEDARQQLEQLLALEPGHKQGHNLMGVLLREKGRFAEAEEHYRAAIASDPDYAPAVRNLAILLDLYQGRLQEALPLYEHYQALRGETDPRVKDWIFDLKRRLGES
ncbi:MAG: hypothetical protein C9356_07860 [Oleiphilus sp.]|nr:MAG: hypothetical protein C9356_07860 [Oleiphilus sp.]